MTIAAFNGEYFPFSSFSRHTVRVAGFNYPTAEHAFHAAKNNSLGFRKAIQKAKTPREAKALGRAVELRPDWEDIKILHMRRVQAIKFTRSQALMELLIDTGDQELIEGNTWHDNFWGDCHCRNVGGKHPECLKPGQNHLGNILENLRTYLQGVPF